MINSRSIAILLAVYNGEKYLEVQVNSIINQSNKDWTLYIRDDSSTDSTKCIINKFCDNYNNIIEIEDNLGNLGCFGNFKELLRVVDSDYYMFCDADDYWLPQKIELSYKFLLEKERLQHDIPIVVHCDKLISDENLKIISNSGWSSIKFDPDLISKYNYIPIYIVGGASAIFNKLLKNVYFEDYPFSDNIYMLHDGWLAFQAARYGKIYAIHEQLMIYRLHSNSVTSNLANSTSISNYMNRLLNISSVLKYHLLFASELEAIGYGGKVKYFYYRIVVAIKLIWGKLTYNFRKKTFQLLIK